MWITSFPGTQCCVSITNAFAMVQMIMHPQVIFICESLYTSNHSTEPLRRRRCSRRSRRTFCFRKFFFVPLDVNWKQLSLTFSGEGTVLWPLLLYPWRKYLVPKKGIAGIENIWYRNKLGRYLDAIAISKSETINHWQTYFSIVQSENLPSDNKLCPLQQICCIWIHRNIFEYANSSLQIFTLVDCLNCYWFLLQI